MIPATATTPTQLVVGTAGHIDHGKSRLVWSLTGTDPDRLPEEKARGMTIDLGFAHLRESDCDIYFVDVPGHERFIRNMVAGATGIDVALLVVAADDSVMPQTREHAELLALLGIPRIAIVITKLDLVEPDWSAQVAEEAATLLRSLGVEPVATVFTSAESRTGFDELKSLLVNLAHENKTAPTAPTWFTMPIDRVFTVAGRGTIVTGTVTHGGVRQNDALTLFPSEKPVRVREIQTHNEARDQSRGRLRLALNITGVATDEITRGQVLMTPGFATASRCFTALLATLRFPGKRPRQRQRVRLHIGAADVLAEIRLAERPADTNLRAAFAQIITAEPLALESGQSFIIRDEAASQTLGGGRVILPDARPWNSRNAPDPQRLRDLSGGSPQRRLAEVLRDRGWQTTTPALLASRAGLRDEQQVLELSRDLIRSGEAILLIATEGGFAVHRDHVNEAIRALRDRMQKFIAANPRSPGLPIAQWPGWIPRAIPARQRPLVADELLKRCEFRIDGGFILPATAAGIAPALPPADAALLEQILAEFRAAGLTPPALDDLFPNRERQRAAPLPAFPNRERQRAASPSPTARAPHTAKKIRQLIDLATARGQLHRVADGFWLHADHWTAVKRQVVAALRERNALTVADIRTLLNSTRKYVVPLVEALDAAGVTKRTGDTRTLGPKSTDL